MVVSFSIDVLEAAKEMIKFLKKGEKEKIPLGVFIKIIEKKYKIKLSKDCKKQLVYSLRERGLIEIVKSKYGKNYVIIGGIQL